MYQVSQEYKESMKNPIRNRSYMVVSIGMINQDVQRSAEVSDQSKYTDFSDFNAIFDTVWNGNPYATFEQDFFKADGSMLFLPKSSSNYKKNGLISSNLFSNNFTVKFTFGCGKADIKGLTIQFGENYPTKFTVSTDSEEATSFVNDSSYFETDKVFSNTESLTITITSMNVANGRVRINYIKFGLGLEYDNEQIETAESQSTLSIIDDDLPQVDFSVTLRNDEQILDIDNPDSAINFFESGQVINVTMGYELDDGSIEWMQLHSLHLSEWSSDDKQANIKAIDKFQLMNDSYYKGKYYENGISLYDLAVLVFEDAGIESDEYYIDPYLKNVKVKNPLPNVGHKEALQIIANAGRCVLSCDRYGRINIHSAFMPDYTTESNGSISGSDVESIDSSSEKYDYATYEKNYWKADGSMLFLKKSGISNCGYVSSQISNSNGTFSSNPIITRTFEAMCTIYSLPIQFQENVVSDFKVRAYADGKLVDSYEVTGNEELYLEIAHEFPELDKLEFEFTKTSIPYSRVKIDYIAPGSETNYHIEYDDLYNVPIGTQLEKVKNLKVSRTMFSKSQTKEDLTSDTITYDGENLLYYFDYPCYGYAVSVESSVTASIVGSGCYYVEVALSGVDVGTEVAVSIQGYKYNESTAYCTKQISNKGNDKEWNNPIISDTSHAQKVTDWIASYFASPVEYDLDFRGEPALDVGDTIFQENRYSDKLKTIIEESQLKFDGTIKGALKTRRKQNVDRSES